MKCVTPGPIGKRKSKKRSRASPTANSTMKITKVRLKNFRQFYGEQEIVFAIDAERNVTLIHAENGFGKTTLLNAILWAFFNQVTAKFEKPDQIVNFAAQSEGTKSASVSVHFDFLDTSYVVERVFEDDGSRRD